jgi:transposase
MIIGCDFHTRYQQIAMLDQATGELSERQLDHQSGEAEAFYRNLQGSVRVGTEATGPIRWFERLLAELGHELWIGDARLILNLLLTTRFPKIWVSTLAERDLRQLLRHRHKLVCLRTLDQPEFLYHGE